MSPLPLLLSTAAPSPESAGLVSAAQDTLLQYGVLGLAVLVLGLFAWSTIRRERARVDDMDKWHREQVMPTFMQATQALSRLTEVLPGVMSDLSAVRKGS